MKSSWKKSDNAAGEWKWTAGKWFGNEAEDKGIQTGPDNKFHSISAELKKPFTNDKKDLVLQFSVKHEQDLDCGGGYIKLMPATRCGRGRMAAWVVRMHAGWWVLHAVVCMRSHAACACNRMQADAGGR